MTVQVPVTVEFMLAANPEQLAVEAGLEATPGSFVQTDPDDLVGSWVYLVDGPRITKATLAAAIAAHQPTWPAGTVPPVRTFLERDIDAAARITPPA